MSGSHVLWITSLIPSELIDFDLNEEYVGMYVFRLYRYYLPTIG
jgi:hypothetical protein